MHLLSEKMENKLLRDLLILYGTRFRHSSGILPVPAPVSGYIKTGIHWSSGPKQAGIPDRSGSEPELPELWTGSKKPEGATKL